MSMALINSSGWSPVKQVTVTTKTELVQGLIFNEVVYKRDKQLRALRKGLENLGLLKLLQMNPELKNLLVFEQSHLTGTLFLSLLEQDEEVEASPAFSLFQVYMESRPCEGICCRI